MANTSPQKTSFFSELVFFFWTLFGTFLAAFALDVFFIPNRLIDGGTVGLAMMMAKLNGNQGLPLFLILFNLPFIALAWRNIGKIFLLHLALSNILFAGWLWLIQNHLHWTFQGETIEVVVIGGVLLGIGLGLVIRMGGSLDGTEVLGIITNKKTGITVGQVVLGCNIFVFSLCGFVFQDWHPPLLSFITFMVASRVMDGVIVGFDETKSVLVISSQSEVVSKTIMEKMGLGLTIMYGRGGFSGEEKEILYVICERLQLASLKSLIFSVDPKAFVAIENLHEVANGNQGGAFLAPKTKRQLLTKVFSRKKY